MISKIIRPGKSFRKTCQYVCQDQSRAQVLDAEGVRSHDYKLMAMDFENQRQMRHGKEKAVFHTILSFQPGEKPSDAQMVELARRCLQGIGVVNTQHAVIRHIDKEHDHLHIIANCVDNSGKSIDNGWIGLKCKKVAQQLTKEYGLIPTQKKNLELTHRDRMTPSDQRLYKIFEIIQDNLPQCRDLADLEKLILQHGVDTRYHYPGGKRSGIPDGISFSIDGESFKGCKIDPEYSIKGLRRILAEQQRQELNQEQELQYHPSHRMRPHF